jgi:transposase
MLKMDGSRVRLTPENVHAMLNQGLSFREIASRCDVFEDAIDASLVRWLNQGRWPIEDVVAA